ncbi:MAG: hypothetical protein ACREA5_07195 [Nitrosotalea sp.]
MVASGPGTTIQMILLDGKPVTSDDAGQDTKDSMITISENPLYNITSSKQAGSHILTVTGHPGFEIYTFTFWQSEHNVSKFEFRNILNQLALAWL